MFSRHITDQLAAHIDGQLTAADARVVTRHLEECAACRAEREQVQAGMDFVARLPLAAAPDGIWTAIEAAAPRVRRAPRDAWRPGWSFPALPTFASLAVIAGIVAAVAAGVAAGVAGVAWWREHQAGPHAEIAWEIAREGRLSRVAPGDWIVTGAGSRATVKVGDIGSLDVAPNTRVRVVSTSPQNHRLALARGEIHATITAPPRLFFVETPAGTAIDLGCEYTLTTGEDGAGLLRVTRGWVSFQWHGLESLVPAGASVRTLPGEGPGLPYFDDAPESLKQEGASIDEILAAARVRDTLTLWHLLQRVQPADRARVFDRMVALTPLPDGVSRDKALALDPATLQHWKEELAWTW